MAFTHLSRWLRSTRTVLTSVILAGLLLGAVPLTYGARSAERSAIVGTTTAVSTTTTGIPPSTTPVPPPPSATAFPTPPVGGTPIPSPTTLPSPTPITSPTPTPIDDSSMTKDPLGEGFIGEVTKETESTGPLTGTFGIWTIDQTNTSGTGAGKPYTSTVKIKFTPIAAKVNCDEIAFVQNTRTLITKGTDKDKPDEPRANFSNRITDKGWTIDRVDSRKYGWYGYDNDGTPSATVTTGKSPKPLTTAQLGDAPKWNRADRKWEFETVVICKSGTDKGKIYGSLTWGFDVDSACKLTSHKPEKRDTPTADFDDAVKKWNAQAAGAASKRNHPDQVDLGPFK